MISLRHKIKFRPHSHRSRLSPSSPSKITPYQSERLVISTFGDFSNLDLMANKVCITILGNVLSYTGQLKRLVKSTQFFFKDYRLVSIALPALVGILPMPGGAIFSAPLVEASCPLTYIGGEVLAFINYWFRHIW
jgi:hypothetical protein